MADTTTQVALDTDWTAVGVDKSYVAVQLRSKGTAGALLHVVDTAAGAPAAGAAGVHIDDPHPFADFPGLSGTSTVYARAVREAVSVVVVAVDPAA